MDKLDFRISEDAAEYISKYLLRTDSGESPVLTIVATTRSKKSDDIDRRLSDHELAALAKEYIKSLPSPIEFEWIVGGMQRSSLPPTAETVLIDGIECFFPDEMRSVINGHVLRLRLGQLVFDPELDPPAVSRIPGQR
jgi:hypothetical protein